MLADDVEVGVGKIHRGSHTNHFNEYRSYLVKENG